MGYFFESIQLGYADRREDSWLGLDDFFVGDSSSNMSSTGRLLNDGIANYGNDFNPLGQSGCTFLI